MVSLAFAMKRCHQALVTPLVVDGRFFFFFNQLRDPDLMFNLTKGFLGSINQMCLL